MFNTLKTIIPLALVCTLLLGYSYIDAQWVGPSTSPTGGNAPAPVNVSANSQNKSGALGVGGLSVFGDAEIVAPSPQLDLIDTTLGNERGWSLRGDGSDLNLLRTDTAGNQVGDPIVEFFYNPGADQYDTRFDWTIRTEGWLRSTAGVWIEDDSPEIRFFETDGSFPGFWRYKIMPNQDFYNIYADRDFVMPQDPDGSALFRLYASSAGSAGDYAQFSNQVRAEQYCDQSGANCIDASSLAGGGALPMGCTDGETLTYSDSAGAWVCAPAGGGGGTTGTYQCPSISGGTCYSGCVGQISNNASCTAAGEECVGGCSGDNPDYGCVNRTYSCAAL
jgi:hypothetical protein